MYSLMQLLPPRPVPPELQASLITEYIAQYMFKAESTDTASKTLASSDALQKLMSSGTKTPEQIARTVLSKALNALNKSVTLGAVFLAHLMFGHGDAQMSYKTQAMNFMAYVASRHPRQADYLYSNGNADSNLTYRTTYQTGHVILANEVDSYAHRHEKLSRFSAIEMVMAFSVVKTSTRGFPLAPGHSFDKTHRHVLRPQQRTNPAAEEDESQREESDEEEAKEKISVDLSEQPIDLHYAQLLSNAPPAPSGTSTNEDKEAYAAFALSVFYPWRYAEPPNGLDGETLWAKYQHWRNTTAVSDPNATRPNDRRAWQDKYAVFMLDNLSLQLSARGYHHENIKVTLVPKSQLAITSLSLSLLPETLNPQPSPCAVHPSAAASPKRT